MTTNTSEQLTFKESVDLLRELHENEWRRRTAWMHWFLLVQGILFAALAQSVQKETVLAVVVCTVGFVTCLSTITAFHYSSLALEAFKEWWTKVLAEAGRDRSEFPPILGLDHKATRPFFYDWIHHLLPWRVLPRLLLVCWLFLGCWVLVNHPVVAESPAAASL